MYIRKHSSQSAAVCCSLWQSIALLDHYQTTTTKWLKVVQNIRARCYIYDILGAMSNASLMPFLNQGSIKIPSELNVHLSRIGKYTMAVTMANVLLIATFTFAEFFVWLALVPFIDWGGLLLLTVDTTAWYRYYQSYIPLGVERNRKAKILVCSETY